ncbi:MAG TPA: ABC transporter ATP-binding protein [Cyclobacteriaceae bacterium]|nr:ABC transporter ATP-binding protein [Cyclobacteriaceae bacterium]HMV10561.1 ABC transporter ATP-binding protein [Cyclobacteriaceae bacterium]HMV88533.1 ABC transporter ATP-binding protein [Cyclobacteriaceae bacterium]HMW99427.1 ABC transporter ATP-binding protein [Cyclobacteriaceae bacterium]HMX48784.1 ABC transporter ATP-binding protein [Cyclobacteriaceae bacterium]
MISIKEVNKTFGKLMVLNNVSIDLCKGKSYALVGPNGSGKTTLIKSILGMVIPSTGDILFDNVSIKNDWKYREKIGYMPQIGHYPENMTIGQIIDMMKNIRKNVSEFDEQLIDEFKLFKMYDKRMHTLSGGTRQKVSAALAFLFNPPALILDEPTAGLDPVSVELLKAKILVEKENGKLIIVSSHILSDLDELTTDMVYLFEGKVHFNNSITSLKEETSEQKLGKAIATMIGQKELIESINK